MLSCTTDRAAVRRILVAGALCAGLLIALARPVRAEAGKAGLTNTSLSFVPADAAFYAANLRNKEQIDLFLKSNAYKTLRNLPLVKMAHGKLMEQLKDDPKSPLKAYEKFVADKDNKELIEVLAEASSDEIFLYGGKTWGDLFKVLGEVNRAQSFAPLKAMLENNDPSKAQARSMLLALQAQRAKLKVPELVFGFKLKDAKKANAQVARLEKILGGLEQVFPPLKGRVHRKKAAEGNFLTVELDGSLIPWDDVNLNEYEDKKDEFEDLLKHLKKMTLSVSLGVKGDYLLLSVSSSIKDLERLDARQPTLAGVAELKPLARFADRRLSGVAYASKAFIEAASGVGNADYAHYGKSLKELLDRADTLKEERKKAIAKDLDALMADFKKMTPSYGAALSFSFLTDTGYEGYAYDFAPHPGRDETRLSLHHHFGGDPIFAAAFAFRADGAAYRATVKWLKIIYGHAEGVFLEMAPEEAKEPYEKFTKAVFPVLKKLDDNTTRKFFPSIKESGLGLVLDGKWKSKRWFKELPPLPGEMPMAELGLLIGVSDARLFEDALKSYRVLLNELLEAGRGAAPMNDNIPEIKIPAPEREVGKNGVLFYYNLPEELGIDKQVLPIAGIGKGASVLCLSKAHAERLMANTPLRMKSKPLAHKGNLLGASLLDWPALVDLSTPWVEFGVRAGLREAKGAKGMDPESVIKQVRIVLTVMKAFKGASSATYLEEGKLVTHTEITIQDLDRVVPPPADAPGEDAPKEKEGR